MSHALVSIVLCSSIVLGELLSGFTIGTREEANRQELQQFLTSERVHHFIIDAEVVEEDMK